MIHSFDEILSNFSKNLFDPLKENHSQLPDSPGVYIICLRSGAKLPKSEFKITLTKFKDYDVLYVGISNKSLKKRDYNQHFNGNAGRSTLRKSIGVLFSYSLIPRDKNPFSKKTKFDDKNELTLSEWMHKNLIMFFIPIIDTDIIEKKLIEHFNPPLNLKSNINSINDDFRKYLSMLRNKTI